MLRLTIGTRIYILIGLGFLGLVGIALLGSHQLASGLRDQKRIELSHVTEVVLTLVQEEAAAADRGTITLDEAKRRAEARVRGLRYGNGDYFFITDMSNRMLMHPMQPELVGKDLSGLTDPNGVKIVAELVDLARKNGSGFLEYIWPKPGVAQPMPKMSYAGAFAPWGWVVTTGVYIDDLDAQTWSATTFSLIAAAIVLLITVVVSVIMARGITKPLHRMTEAMKALAGGRLDVEVPGVGRHDEVGEMADAVEVFKTNAVARARLEAEQKETEARAAAQRRDDMHKLAHDFEAAVGGIVGTVSSAATELEATAGTLTRTADLTRQMAGTVTTASDEASTNVQAVAAATDEMTSSIGEIGRQVQASSRIADEAVRQAEKTDARVTALSQAASRIGDVVQLITAIAEQTNLLALNATIEAARAGEAGKGFAVVAQEVKALAAQTGKATGEISAQIAGMQSATQESVAAIKEIGETIGKIAEIAAAIAAAVEEQGAATSEISRNIQQAATGTTQVAAHIGEVSRGAEETGAASGEVLNAAGQLAGESNRLRLEVEKFLDNVRAA
ncbi:Methyl-accepting chemotaxis receptor protein [Rhodovulum sp. PH10]|uniref:methyl-accepting chemotaxis protein n=1 Tax=Rhodovulum sp. PH10 TaxID=1187851 RepID=UPI00027C2ED5|nr:Methyl-accepting chemotaxis receptor protein [Rhodovulum sp. PH10]